MSTNPTQSSQQADDQLVRAELPDRQEIMEGTKLHNSVCERSCLRPDNTCLGALNYDASQRLSEWRDPEKKWGENVSCNDL
jgi:hypothetical protein